MCGILASFGGDVVLNASLFCNRSFSNITMFTWPLCPIIITLSRAPWKENPHVEQNYLYHINYCQANKRTIFRLSSRRSKTHFNSFVVIIGRCLLRHLSNSRVLCEHVAFSSLRSKYAQDFKIIVKIFRREVLLSDGRAKKVDQEIRARVFVLL